MLYLLVALLGAAPTVSVLPDTTCFQSYAPYDPAYDIGSDVVMVYGVGDSFVERASVWRRKGYDVSLMTGIAWGEYGAYYGDGESLKREEVQTEKSGRVRMHGNSTNVGYNVPSAAYVDFIKRYIDPAIDAGIRAVYLEEPEFWANTGWSESFKREWELFYKEPWQEPDSSPDAQYRASKLKYELYFRALLDVFAHVKMRAENRGEQIECHVPTHSMINYAQWRIVSPESHLIDIPHLDGYVAQVWTGTARSHCAYEGVAKERTFETAYLEYGQMVGMTRPTRKKLWFLHDPVEDNPNRSWNDYRTNYESTVIASLLWPEVSRFEVMPWPDRIFHGEYAPVDMEVKTGSRQGIPEDYATEILTILNALNDMEQTDVRYESGTRGIGVIVSDTMMFQRADPSPSDPLLGSFYGLAIPLMKAGVPVEVVQLENVIHKSALAPYSLLLLTYEHQKPLKQQYHAEIASWVKEGGRLLFIEDGTDPYHEVREWWNDDGAKPSKAYDDLFAALGVGGKVWEAPQQVGKGYVRAISASPAKLTYELGGSGKIRTWVNEMLATREEQLTTAPALTVLRGPYVITSVLDEAPTTNAVQHRKGIFLDVFDPQFEVVRDVSLAPGKRTLLFDIEYAKAHGPAAQVLTASSRIRNEVYSGDTFQFTARGPEKTSAKMRILLPGAPAKISSEPSLNIEHIWDSESGTVYLKFPNIADIVTVQISL